MPFEDGSVMVWGGIRGQERTSMVQLSYSFCNISHVVSFISMITPDPIQLELYKTSLAPTISMCCCSLYACQTCPHGSSCSRPSHPPPNQQELIQGLQRGWLCIPHDLIRRLHVLRQGVVIHVINPICHRT